MTPRFRVPRRVPAWLPCLLLLLVATRADTLWLSPVDRAAAPHSFSVAGWVALNLPAKALEWLHAALPWAESAPAVPLETLEAYFRLGEEVAGLRRELDQAVARAAAGGAGDPGVEALERRVLALQGAREAMAPAAERALEGILAATLREEGLVRGAGPLQGLFPPVAVRLERLPSLLVVSPRDRILLAETRLLSPGLALADIEEVERVAEAQGDRSALVTGLGGLALYPSLAPDSQPLRTALQTVAHEWLHQYWLFYPLGRSYFASPEMTTLNETAAEMAGRELGDMAYKRLGYQLPRPVDTSPDGGDGFDFAGEMRTTRREVDRLLGEGLVDAAEGYMEERRAVFVRNGYPIRRLNQAYFAFHGTYAESPASTSPIADQLRRVRERAPGVGAFVREVARMGSYQELVRYLERGGG